MGRWHNLVGRVLELVSAVARRLIRNRWSGSRGRWCAFRDGHWASKFLGGACVDPPNSTRSGCRGRVLSGFVRGTFCAVLDRPPRQCGHSHPVDVALG